MNENNLETADCEPRLKVEGDEPSTETPFNASNQAQTIIPEQAKKIALARMDLVHQWREFRHKVKNKMQADYDFVQMHNSGDTHLHQILGTISRGSLHRWQSKLNDTEDYAKLLPQYKYSSINDYRTCLTDEEIKIFMGLLLHPNRISIGKAISLTKYNLQQKNQSFIPADVTFRRYAKWFKDNNFDKWVLMRDGEKALADKVEPFLKRDASLLEVGDVLVADGHRLNFQVINPFTGKATRATLVGFLDWKSTALVGYEIMLEENTQCIASALRQAILNLDMIPKVVYQDNGRAFRAKYFTDDRGFNELGFSGLYSKLGIQTVFARPYNARSKVIERFFKEFQEGFERLLPSFTGSSIDNKPAYLMRNEKFHKNIHNKYIPTIEETIKMIDMWLDFKNSQPCPNAPNKSISEVLEERKTQNINLDTLNDLMLATEVKTIQRNGIKFLNCDYFDDRLYGFKSKVLIKYSLFDLSEIMVYTTQGEFLCTAKRVTMTHPMAKILGDMKDLEDYKQKIQKQQKLRRKTLNSVKDFLPKEDVKFLEMQMTEDAIEVKEIASSEKSPRNDIFINGRPIFKNNFEKYEWLVKNDPANQWLKDFQQSKEYSLMYGEAL